MITEMRRRAARAIEDSTLEAPICWAEVADCVCPDPCERDHSSE